MQPVLTLQNEQLPSRGASQERWSLFILEEWEGLQVQASQEPAPAEKGSDTEREAGSEKKNKKKKKAKAALTGSLWEDSESEAESTFSEEELVDSDAETTCAPATPRAKLYYPKKEEDKERGFPGLGWVRGW